MKPEIRLSVALVTRNRPDSLLRCLESLRKQEIQPFEVIVSDDSDEGAAPKSRQVAESFGCLYVKGPKRGLYANRNFAALQCKGTHIRTMDDDHTFPTGHFTRCLQAVDSDPRAIWTTGEISFLGSSFHDKTDTASQLHAAGVGGAVDDPDNNWAISDGSTIYPRDVFDQGGRIVEEFSFGSSYLEFGAYLYKLGWKSRCIPEAWIEHHIDPDLLPRDDGLSRAYASICFNLFFRTDRFRLGRYLLPLVGRNPSITAQLPHLLALARKRWSSMA